MAVYNPTVPPLFLSGTVSQITTYSTYPHADEPDMQNIAPYEYEITVGSISAQQTYSSSVRSANKQYTAIDIKAGDWITDASGESVLRIIRVLSKSDGQISFIARDIDAVSFKTYGQNGFSADQSLGFFEVSDDGSPAITGAPVGSFFPTALSIDKIQGRFEQQTETETFRFEFDAPQSNFSVGDTVTVDSTTGGFVLYNASSNASVVPLGIITGFTMGDTVVYVKPFNKLVDNYPEPSLLNGSTGDIYYTDPANPGKMTLNKVADSVPIFLQVADAVPTVVTSTLANYLPDGDDVLFVNNVPVYNGSANTINNTSDLVDLINGASDATGVVGSFESVYASVETDETLTSFGDSYLVLSSDSGATYGSMSFSIGDTNTLAQVTIGDPATVNTTYGTNVSLVPFPSANQYLTYDAVAIAEILNTVFTSNNMNLVASVTDDGETYKHLKITSTSATSGIEIVATDTDQFGQTFAVGMGLATNTPATSGDFLIMTKDDGGDILLTGNNNYWNSNGLTSSSFGSPAVLLMLEGVKDGGDAVVTSTGVNVKDDTNQSPLTTSADGDSTGCTITYTPFSDSAVSVEVNGIEANVGDGAKDEACYFSADGGTTAKAIADIAAGDTLYWMGSIAGFELDPTDDIDINYQASSTDIS